MRAKHQIPNKFQFPKNRKKGIEILEIKPLATGAKTLAQALYGFSYEIHLPENIEKNQINIIRDNIGKFLTSPSFNISRLSKGKTINKNIRPFVKSIAFNPSENTVEFTAGHTQEGSARPVDIITHVLGFSNEEAPYIYVTKIKTILLPID